jgi:energy-coupling factor transport system permease protein
MLGLCTGAYGLLDASAPPAFGLPALLAGSLLCCAGLALGGRRVRRTAYRPDPWRAPEWTVALGGCLCAGVLVAAARQDPAALNPGLYPLAWPPLPWLSAAAILLAGAAAFAAPPPVRRAPSPGREAVITRTPGDKGSGDTASGGEAPSSEAPAEGSPTHGKPPRKAPAALDSAPVSKPAALASPAPATPEDPT